MNVPAYQIKTVQEAQELDLVYDLAVSILGRLDHTRHCLEYYRRQARLTPTLLVYAVQGDTPIGCALGSVEEDHVLVGPVAVVAGKRGLGVGLAMLRRLEEEARRLGQTTLILGALQEAEGFYLACGYRPNLFVQAPGSGQLARMKEFNRGYTVAWEAQDGDETRLMLAMPRIDRELQDVYRQLFPGCHTQVVFIKNID